MFTDLEQKKIWSNILNSRTNYSFKYITLTLNTATKINIFFSFVIQSNFKHITGSLFSETVDSVCINMVVVY